MYLASIVGVGTFPRTDKREFVAYGFFENQSRSYEAKITDDDDVIRVSMKNIRESEPSYSGILIAEIGEENFALVSNGRQGDAVLELLQDKDFDLSNYGICAMDAARAAMKVLHTEEKDKIPFIPRIMGCMNNQCSPQLNINTPNGYL